MSESGPVCPIAALAMNTSGSHRSTEATSRESVMSSFATVRFGSALRSSAACASFSTVAITLWPRPASMLAAMRPKPVPAPVMRTVLGMVSPPFG
jgi:hypothetical protein